MKETAQLESTITACLAPNNSTASTAHERKKLSMNGESSLAPTHVMALSACSYHYCSTARNY
uniref:Uncharacterized protein n=1 Tax=Arundo donax TaxID=35708 RepID=A0A0A9F8F3_ARUDO